jgi:hypothetical protein
VNEPFQTEKFRDVKPNTDETLESLITCMKEQSPYCGFSDMDRKVDDLFINTDPELI